MNRHMLARGAALVGVALALSACDQGLTEVNVDPNAPTDVTAEYMLPFVLQSVVGGTCCSRGMLDDWAQQTSEIQYPEETIANVRPGTMDGTWSAYYATRLKNIQAIVQKGVDGQYANIEGVGMIWRAYTFSQMTDLWGDIPYSEALKGADNITPIYDQQKDIYAGMLKNLADAQAMLGATGPGDDFGDGDVLYDNAWAQWRKFANSLRMRLAMRMSNVDEATAKAEFVAAMNAGPFASNADNAQLVWPGDPWGNPNWENCICGNGVRDDNGVSATMVDTLLSLSDPRLKFYAEPATEADSAALYGGTFDGQAYYGEVNGDHTPDHPLGWYSRIGNYWRADGENTPSIIMDYSEVLFLEAEAAWRGWITADPAALYTQAVEAAFDMYSPAATGSYPTAPTTAERDAYLQNPRVVYNTTDANAAFAQIQLQKWISLYQVGMEAWTNWRRVRIPHLVPGPDLAAGNTPTGVTIIPVRVPYPSNEQSFNNDNLMAAVTRQGGGLSLITNMWWDVNPNN